MPSGASSSPTASRTEFTPGDERFRGYKANLELTLEYSRARYRHPARRESAIWPTPLPRPTRLDLLERSLSPSTTSRRNVLAPDQSRPADRPRRAYGSGVNPLRCQKTASCVAHMGARPIGCPASSMSNDDSEKFTRLGRDRPPETRLAPSDVMFDAMERGYLNGRYGIGENSGPVRSDQKKAIDLLEGLELLVVQDIFRTATPSLPTSSGPALRRLAEAYGTVHQFRASGPARPQGARATGRGPRRPVDQSELAPPMGADYAGRPPRTSGTRSARCRPPRRGCRTALEELGGLSGRATTRTTGELFLHSLLGGSPFRATGCRSSRSITNPPVDSLPTYYPIRSPGPPLDSYHTVFRYRGYTRRCACANRSTSRRRMRRARVAAGDRSGGLAARLGRGPDSPRLVAPPRATFMTLHFQTTSRQTC